MGRAGAGVYGPACRHCGRAKVNRPLGLCWACYYAPAVRALYPSASRYCPGGAGGRPRSGVVAPLFPPAGPAAPPPGACADCRGAALADALLAALRRLDAAADLAHREWAVRRAALRDGVNGVWAAAEALLRQLATMQGGGGDGG
jgi:hypothetical protein